MKSSLDWTFTYKGLNTLKIRKEVNRNPLILDAGCGTGLLSVEASRRGFTVIAIDLSKKQLEHSKKIFQTENVCIPLVRSSLTHLPFRDTVFDSVICCDVIEHIPKRGFVFSEFHRILVCKGNICLTTPNGYGCYGILFDGILRYLFFLSYLSKTSQMLRKKEIETYHVHRVTPNILRKLAYNYHLKIVQFFNTEFLTTLYHFILRVILKRDQIFINRIQKLDAESANLLPLRLGSEWFLCLAKL